MYIVADSLAQEAASNRGHARKGRSGEAPFHHEDFGEPFCAFSNHF